MPIASRLKWSRIVVAAVIASLCGCAAMSNKDDADGLKLADPSPSFMKKVERDPFPNANGAKTSGS